MPCPALKPVTGGGFKVACVGDASEAGVGDYNMKSITELVEIAKG